MYRHPLLIVWITLLFFIPLYVSAIPISSSQINLSWTASTDNIEVTGYKVFRDSVQIATVTNTSYNDIGLSPSTTYIYTVSAFDIAGNNSGQSMAVSASTFSIYKFSIGDRIKVITNKLAVRKTPGGKNLGFQYFNAQGTVIGGPSFANGYTWWNINYDITPDGWSAENYLEKVSLTYAPAPAFATASSSLSPETKAQLIMQIQQQISDLQQKIQKLLGH